MEIRSFYLAPGGEIGRDLTPEGLDKAREDTGNLLWVDIFDPQFEAGPLLLDQMGFHPVRNRLVWG